MAINADQAKRELHQCSFAFSDGVEHSFDVNVEESNVKVDFDYEINIERSARSQSLTQLMHKLTILVGMQNLAGLTSLLLIYNWMYQPCSEMSQWTSHLFQKLTIRSVRYSETDLFDWNEICSVTRVPHSACVPSRYSHQRITRAVLKGWAMEFCTPMLCQTASS